MKAFAAFLALAVLVACSSTPAIPPLPPAPQEVRVAVPVPCQAPERPAPQVLEDAALAMLPNGELVLRLDLDRRRWRDYAGQLSADLAGCR